MNIVALFNALPGACAQGLIWGIMAIGVFITYKILDLADLTVDGTMCTGGAVCIVMMIMDIPLDFPCFAHLLQVCWLVWQRVFSIQQWESRQFWLEF